MKFKEQGKIEVDGTIYTIDSIIQQWCKLTKGQTKGLQKEEILNKFDSKRKMIIL
jgi:hypothetical protein